MISFSKTEKSINKIIGDGKRFIALIAQSPPRTRLRGETLGRKKVSDPAIELYDLDKDPQEMNNVAAQNPEIVKKMAEIFSKEHQYNPAWPLLFKEIKR